jgi:phosphate transport system permease protein
MNAVGMPSPRPAQEIDLPQLQKSLRHPRTAFNSFMSLMTGVVTFVAMVPLASVLIQLAIHGGQRVDVALFTELPPEAKEVGGGIGNALLGTIVIVLIATAISVPIGILAAVYLAEFGPETRTAAVVRFATKVLTGLPSILAGVFAVTTVVILTGTLSAPAGGIALAVLMLPTIVLTSEEAIRMVPQRMKEAAIGMGATRTQMVCYVILPTAFPGILTGVMLAIARAVGETAPLILAAGFYSYWARHLMQPTASMGYLIYEFAGTADANQIQIAWACALVLVVMVLILNLASQVILRRSFSHIK